MLIEMSENQVILSFVGSAWRDVNWSGLNEK